MSEQKEPTEKSGELRCSTLEEFSSMTQEQREEFIHSVEEPSRPENIGRTILFWGESWKIYGINYLGDYDIERTDSRGKRRSSCRLGIPSWHPHYAVLDA